MAEENKIYITASELAEMLGVSVGHAYKIIRKLNQELAEQGFLVIAGKVPRRYLEKRWYGYST
ncbi:HTH domain-containing protein [Coprococcus sp. B2-R-112]|uniref:HTH domain-containing protein n=1 Tax=Coprococcus sp. B2-R-112 TaxID=2949662 RepID=UPI0020306293|nr:HTH domain-containing protein [Coprococcus sp. B2-R-112]MCM0664017.1 HTH domain-containing protein [Coprococcus sp. B2-R-112]